MSKDLVQAGSLVGVFVKWARVRYQFLHVMFSEMIFVQELDIIILKHLGRYCLDTWTFINFFLQIIYGSKFNYHTIAQNFMILQGSYLKVLCWEVWAIWNVYAPVNGCCISILVIMDHVLRIAHDCTKIYSVHHRLFANRNRSLVLFYSHLSFSQIMSCFDWKIKSWECFLESMRSLKLNNIFGNYQSVAQALRLASFHGTYCWCDYSHRSPSWVRYFFSGTQSVV